MNVFPICTSVHDVHAVSGGPKRELDPLRLEVQMAMSGMWVLGIEPDLSGTALGVLFNSYTTLQSLFSEIKI